jgi:hypothetical protein
VTQRLVLEKVCVTLEWLLQQAKAIAQLFPRRAWMLTGLLNAKYRQLLDVKCVRARVELSLIAPA